MLGIPAYTLRYWEKEFDALSPARVGNCRRYSDSDVETVRRIKELLYDRRLTVEATKRAMSGDRKYPPRQDLKCNTARTAIRLMDEIAAMSDNDHIIARVKAVKSWINHTDSEN